MDYKNREDFSEELKRTFEFIEETLVNELPTATISLDYILLAILEKKDTTAYTLLNNCLTQTTLDTIQNVYFDKLNKNALSAIRPNRAIKWSEETEKIVEFAKEEIREEEEPKKLNTSHILLCILNNNTAERMRGELKDAKKLLNESIKKVLNKAGTNYTLLSSANDIIEPKEQNDIKKEKKPSVQSGIQVIDINNIGDLLSEFGGKGNKKGSAIESYCTNLNELAEQGKIDNLVGRRRELNEVIKVLCRRTKNNAILVGPDGCGKTAICKGLADLINKGEVPQQIANCTVLMFNPTTLIAGTTYRGMLEERMKQLFDELNKKNDYILFIDDISNIFTEKQKSDNNSASIWNGILEDGKVHIIGTASFKEYRNTFDTNPNIGHKFQKILIEAPSFSDSMDILNGVKGYYEDFHNITYTDEAIETCVKLAEKFITDRNLPDSAIDLLDETGAYVNINANDREVTKLNKEIKDIEKEIASLKIADKYDEADAKDLELKKKKLSLIDREKKNKKAREKEPIVVGEDVIYKVVSDKTGIPITKLTTDDKQRLARIDDVLKSSIIGQDEAIEKVCRSIKRNRVGLTNNKTYASFLMIGKTGVGKTLLAKKLAKEIFGNENMLVRFDMSEYTDKTSVSKLIGSNPGYVGYENGGLLTEAIKNKKHCVLLLDEIEKADKEVYNLFLQVFDEGFLTDNSGQKIDFKNVIIILTSNVGAKEANAFGKGIGFNIDEEKNKESIISKEVKKKFPPEFLNRLNNIISFNSLTEDDYKKIISLELNKTKDKIKDMGYSFSYSDAVIDKLYDKIKDEKEYGARPVLRIIQNEIEDKITDLIIENNDKAEGFKVDVINNDILVNEEV